jgi:hypothetical protein
LSLYFGSLTIGIIGNLHGTPHQTRNILIIATIPYLTTSKQRSETIDNLLNDLVGKPEKKQHARTAKTLRTQHPCRPRDDRL